MAFFWCNLASKESVDQTGKKNAQEAPSLITMGRFIRNWKCCYLKPNDLVSKKLIIINLHIAYMGAYIGFEGCEVSTDKY